MNTQFRMRLIGGVVAVALTAASLPYAWGGTSDWWHPAWPYRKIVKLPGDSRKTGQANVASVWLQTGGRGLVDGSDIRVIGPKGQSLPFGIVHSTPEARHLLVLQAPEDAEACAIYFGNPRAQKPHHVFPKRGLVLETRPIPKNASAKDWDSAKKAIEESEEVYGVDYWPKVFDGHNPFGPQRDYISIYRGHIHCPSAGTYRFATLSDDSSFLLVDGEMVAKWPGRHDIRRGRRGQHGGRIRLGKGVHRFAYIAFAYGGPRRAAAAWIPPDKEWWEIIPHSAFSPPLKAEVVKCERLGSSVCADFEPQTVHYCESGSARMIAVKFVSISSATKGLLRSYRWQFGDGQTSGRKEAVHVYFAPGVYDVTLSVTATTGARNMLRQKVRVRPLWHDLDFRKRKLDRMDRLTHNYKVEKLPTEMLLSAWEFFGNIERRERAFQAAVELDKRRSELGPSQIYDVAMSLAGYYQKWLHKQETAEQYFELALKNAEDAPRKQFNARFRLAEHYLDHMHRPDMAMEAYQSLREDFPRADPVRRRIARIRIGDIYRNQGKLRNAKEIYLEAEQESAYVPAQPRAVVSGRFAHDVESYLLRGDGETALALLERWLWHYPTKRLSGDAMLLRVRVNLLLKNYHEAKRQAELYTKFGSDPDYVPRLHVAAGEACIELGLAEQAREHFQAVLGKFRESPSIEDAENGLARLPE